MNMYHTLILTVATVALAFSSWLVFCTRSALGLAKSLERASSNPITHEPWYPLWLRFEGIWMFAVVAFILSIVFKGSF